MGPESSTVGSGIDQQTPELDPPFFYHSSPDPTPNFWEQYGIYERATCDVLGDEDNTVTDSSHDQSRCFNCGNPDHKVTECPFRLNRDLIALSRQYYQFYQGSLGLGNWQRIHAVEAWRQQRLNWLEDFEPGKIKGELLKDALDSGHEEWLRNISVWGYPRGWVSKTDPQEYIRAIIWNECYGDVDVEFENEFPFKIHGEEDRIETVSFQDAFQRNHNKSKADDFHQADTPSLDSPPRSRANSPDTTSSGTALSAVFPPPSPSALTRWANYPLSYFSSQHLILYNPPPPSEPWSSTVFEDTSAYLYQFIPPPPAEEPPPLPPSLTPPSPPLPPSWPTPLDPFVDNLFSTPKSQSTQPVNFTEVKFDQVELFEGDMDMSDSE